jgi:hypothetical protein
MQAANISLGERALNARRDMHQQEMLPVFAFAVVQADIE